MINELGVLQLDQRMPILLTMNKHRLQPSTAVFSFKHAERNLIKLKLYSN